MNNFLRSGSLILFIVIFIGFAFPFTTTTYRDGNAISLTGFDILGSIKQEVVSDENEETEPNASIPSNPTINSENTLALSVFSASIGIATTQLTSPQSAIVTAIAAGLGSGSLWEFKNRNEQLAWQQAETVEKIDFRSGFFTCLGSYVGACVFNLLRCFQKIKR